jgi:hypothetical protein
MYTALTFTLGLQRIARDLRKDEHSEEGRAWLEQENRHALQFSSGKMQVSLAY